MGNIAVARAGHPDAEPVVMLHGLGGTKASFLPTVAALADEYRVHAIDLPGFGDSVKPLRAAYDPHFFARAVCGFMDAAGIESAHLIGNSMGGRVAFEVGFRNSDRVKRIVGLTPALAWLRSRGWTPLVKALRPELGLIQITPRPVFEQAVRRLRARRPQRLGGGRRRRVPPGVHAAPRPGGVLRGAAQHLPRRARGRRGLLHPLRALEHESLFVWGKQDRLVPIAFARHVREALPGARHVELDCGHVPQLEAPRETHAAIRRFLRAG